ncbi:IDEAL domain-containing protein [Paenibacillus sp.]|uniref:IDEAL domain-containing protein n=1 Tax=Paenibacillus sp. TaxID=58172 RepID=UPI002D5530B8|nr:IDEAL domain-containing protein [Paenibacillus sp.]HZG55152.1 IDEAL domain-containing protein [Paenibacillus sp.]
MTEQRKANWVPEGEWVGGTSVNDERIRGYVREYDAMTGYYAIAVVESDHAEAVGRTVFARASQIKPLSASVAEHPEALRELIDVALAARDKAWFYELTAELLTLEARRGAKAEPALA